MVTAVPAIEGRRRAGLQSRLEEKRYVLTGVNLNKISCRTAQVTLLEARSVQNFSCDILRNIFRPTLSGVEGDNPNGGAELCRHQSIDHGLQIGLLLVCLDVGAA